MTQDTVWSDDQHCFLCGALNEQGLKLAFHTGVDGSLSTRWTAEKRFQGYAGILHGGIISAILDEVMVNLPWKVHGRPVATAELTVRLRKPVPIGTPLSFRAWVEERGERVWRLKAECRGDAQELYAEASVRAVAISMLNGPTGPN